MALFSEHCDGAIYLRGEAVSTVVRIARLEVQSAPFTEYHKGRQEAFAEVLTLLGEPTTCDPEKP